MTRFKLRAADEQSFAAIKGLLRQQGVAPISAEQRWLTVVADLDQRLLALRPAGVKAIPDRQLDLETP